MFFVLNKVGGGDYRIVVQKEAQVQRVQAKIVDLMLGINIDGVFMNMQALV